jgi:hypothetical protein
MTSQINFKIDTRLKNQAMKKAQNEGIPFASVLKLATQAYVTGKLDVQLVAQPKLNAKTRRELIKISKDIKAGKNIVGPFETVADMKKYLMK